MKKIKLILSIITLLSIRLIAQNTQDTYTKEGNTLDGKYTPVNGSPFFVTDQNAKKISSENPRYAVKWESTLMLRGTFAIQYDKKIGKKVSWRNAAGFVFGKDYTINVTGINEGFLDKMINLNEGFDGEGGIFLGSTLKFALYDDAILSGNHIGFGVRRFGYNGNAREKDIAYESNSSKRYDVKIIETDLFVEYGFGKVTSNQFSFEFTMFFGLKRLKYDGYKNINEYSSSYNIIMRPSIDYFHGASCGFGVNIGFGG